MSCLHISHHLAESRRLRAHVSPKQLILHLCCFLEARLQGGWGGGVDAAVASIEGETGRLIKKSGSFN